jgi:hypothetical protein
MNNTTDQKSQTTEARDQVVTEKRPTTLVDTLFDIGLSWADFSVGQGKRALEQSAKTLEKVAASLNELQHKLRKE